MQHGEFACCCPIACSSECCGVGFLFCLTQQWSTAAQLGFDQVEIDWSARWWPFSFSKSHNLLISLVILCLALQGIVFKFPREGHEKGEEIHRKTKGYRRSYTKHPTHLQPTIQSSHEQNIEEKRRHSAVVSMTPPWTQW
jgi:hypothetical protein